MSEQNQNPYGYIDFFDLYPDEPLISGVARYRQKMLISTTRQVNEILFGKNVKQRLDLPKYLNNLVASLAPGHWLTNEKILNDHTLYPLTSPWLTYWQRKKLRNRVVYTSLRNRLPYLKPFTAIEKDQKLKYCPLCINEDKIEFGECYWHRLHQVVGVEVCIKHHVYLRQTHISSKTMCEKLIPLEDVEIETNIKPMEILKDMDYWFFLTASDVWWLLNQVNLHFNDTFTSYWSAGNFFTPSNRICRINRNFNKYKGAILKQLESYTNKPNILLSHINSLPLSESELLSYGRFDKTTYHTKYSPVEYIILLRLVDFSIRNIFT